MNEHLKHDHCWWSLAVFVLTWLLVVGGVYPNGDDIAHLTKQIRLEQFVPVLGPHWIPNRIVDMYGRTLLTLGVEWWYGILHPWTGMDFFRVYQLLSASVMATLTAAVFAYIDWRARLAGGQPSALARITLLVLLLTLLSWRNQVHLMAYQLPAVLGFILLWELHQWVSAAPDRKPFDPARIPSLCVLSYLTAFSMEAYALLILLVWPWLAWAAWRTHAATRQVQRHQLPVAAIATLGFSAALQIIALLLVAFYSERVKVSNNGGGSTRPHLASILEGQIGWFLREGRFVTLTCLAGLGYWMWRMHRAPAATVNHSFRPAAQKEATFIVIALISNILMVTIVSHSAKSDYFSHVSYPWGDFLLIGKLTLACGFFHWLSRLEKSPWIARAAITLAVAVGISRMIPAVLDNAIQKQNTARIIAKSYQTASTHDASLIYTGLNLPNIHETIRPLPTTESPEWFKQGYRQLLEKYYGIRHQVYFE